MSTNSIYPTADDFPPFVSLTLEDLFENAPVAASEPVPRIVKTSEPERWASILFEPADVLEFRFFPSKEAASAIAPKIFLMEKTARQHSFNRWVFAGQINSRIEKLGSLNKGNATWWGRWDGGSKRWYGVHGEGGFRLNIYCSANPRIATGCSLSEDVMLARSLFVDLEQISIEQALQMVNQRNLPQPSMSVVSGHGVHFYWRLTEPIFDLKEWTRYQKQLIQLFGSDPAIHDPARLMRLPNFDNVNGTPAKCFIYEADQSRRYSLDALLPDRLSPVAPPTSAPASMVEIRIEGDSNLERAIAYARTFRPSHDNRNTTAFQRSCALIAKFNLSEEETHKILADVNRQSSDPLDETELENVVSKAFRFVTKRGKNGTRPVFHEQAPEPAGTLMELAEWRKQMKAARLETLSQNGVYCDRSPTGAGKSTADITLLRVAKKSAVFLPTHEACQEFADQLLELGLNAAAHPPLNESTCSKFGTKEAPKIARIAQNAGLSVGASVCPYCELSRTCTYQHKRELARTANHVVATHARASLSDFEPATGKPVAFIHESALDLFRPAEKIVAISTRKDVPQLSHLHELSVIANQVKIVAASWGDQTAIDFSKKLIASVAELVNYLASPLNTTTPKVTELPLKQQTPPPDHLDYLLRCAMDQIKLHSRASVLRFVLGFALGQLETLCEVVDETREIGGKKQFVRGLVAVWKRSLPKDTVVWVEDASSSAQLIEQLTGTTVTDKTPLGILKQQVPPVQYAEADVTQKTGGKTIRGIVRGLLARHRSAQKVGIITHQVHKAEIRKLSDFWGRRIKRIEHFHSGNDRASNSWLECDLILVIGTPRIPATAIRDTLIRLGKIKEAATAGGFGDVIWTGATVSGNLKTVTGYGYSEESWYELHSLLVKETLRQAVGRGRGVTDAGVPVIVVSSECVGLSLADDILSVIDDATDATLMNLMQLTDIFQNKNGDRTVRRHLARLVDCGLVTRKSERGAVILADWVIASANES